MDGARGHAADRDQGTAAVKRAIAHRDGTPRNMSPEQTVELRRIDDHDDRRLRRVADILLDILDSHSTPGEAREP